MAALHFAGRRERDGAVPVEHVHGDAARRDPRRARRSQFVDCNREDLCMSFADFEAKAEQHKPKAAILVHIGGHIAFDSEQIAEYCAANDIFLIEDCAHAHGASWNGRRPGAYGDAGVYSLYATKTISTGEGGVLVSRRPELIEHTRGVPQLRQADLRGPGPQLPDERVHRRARPDPDRAAAGDRRLEERGGAHAPGSRASEPSSSCPRG